MAIITALALLGSIDAEQPHELRAEFDSVAVHDLEAWLCRSDNRVVICFRVSCGGQHEGKKTETPY